MRVIGGGLIGGVGLILILIGLAFTGNVLATLTVDTTPPIYLQTNPSGTIPTPQIMTAGSPGGFSFQLIIQEDNSLFVNPVNCTPPAVRTNCVFLNVWYASVSTGPWRSVFNSTFAGTVASIVPAAVVAPPISTLSSTTQAAFLLGKPVYIYTVKLAPIPLALKNNWIRMDGIAFDIAGNTASTSQYGFLDTPTGFFIVNGQKVDQTSTIITNLPTISFQFNASVLPALITGVNLIITNLTVTPTPPPSNLCYVGAGCFQPAYTGTGLFYAYPSWPLLFSNGNYNLTGTFNCSGCALPVYRVLSILGTLGIPPMVGFPFGWALIGAGAVLAAVDFGMMARGTGRSFMIGSGSKKK